MGIDKGQCWLYLVECHLSRNDTRKWIGSSEAAGIGDTHDHLKVDETYYISFFDLDVICRIIENYLRKGEDNDARRCITALSMTIKDVCKAVDVYKEKKEKSKIGLIKHDRTYISNAISYNDFKKKQLTVGKYSFTVESVNSRDGEGVIKSIFDGSGLQPKQAFGSSVNNMSSSNPPVQMGMNMGMNGQRQMGGFNQQQQEFGFGMGNMNSNGMGMSGMGMNMGIQMGMNNMSSNNSQVPMGMNMGMNGQQQMGNGLFENMGMPGVNMGMGSMSLGGSAEYYDIKEFNDDFKGKLTFFEDAGSSEKPCEIIFASKESIHDYIKQYISNGYCRDIDKDQGCICTNVGLGTTCEVSITDLKEAIKKIRPISVEIWIGNNMGENQKEKLKGPVNELKASYDLMCFVRKRDKCKETFKVEIFERGKCPGNLKKWCTKEGLEVIELFKFFKKNKVLEDFPYSEQFCVLSIDGYGYEFPRYGYIHLI